MRSQLLACLVCGSLLVFAARERQRAGRCRARGKRGERPNIDRVCGRRRAGFAGPRRHDAAVVGSADQRPRDRAHAAQRRRRRESRQPLRHHAVVARGNEPQPGARCVAARARGRGSRGIAARRDGADGGRALRRCGVDPTVARCGRRSECGRDVARRDGAHVGRGRRSRRRGSSARGRRGGSESRVARSRPRADELAEHRHGLDRLAGRRLAAVVVRRQRKRNRCCARADRSRRRSRYPRSRTD